MMVRRAHIAKVFGCTREDMVDAEADGLPAYTKSLIDKGNKSTFKFYELHEVILFFHTKQQINLQRVLQLIYMASTDARALEMNGNSPSDDAQTLMWQLVDGGRPNFPNPTIAKTVTAAYKNYVDAQTKEQDRKMKSGELVDKSLLMNKVNQVANLYEDKFGEAFFRKIQGKQEDLQEAMEQDMLYEFIRDNMAQEHDDIIEEINRIEAGIT